MINQRLSYKHLSARFPILRMQLLNILIMFSMIVPNLPSNSPRLSEPGEAIYDLSGRPWSNSKYAAPATSQRPTISRAQPRVGERPQPGMDTQSVDQNSTPGASLMFIENVGQFDSKAEFAVQGAMGTVLLSQSEIWITYFEQDDSPSLDLMESPGPTLGSERVGIENERPEPRKGVHLRLQFVGANLEAEVEGIDPLETTVSYFLGNDSSQWYPDVPVWSGVRFRDLYPGMDLEITGLDSQWSWRLVVEDAERLTEEGSLAVQEGIRLQVEGAKGLALEGNSLRFATEIRDIIIPALPVVRGDTTSAIKPQPMEVANTELIILSPESVSKLKDTPASALEENSTNPLNLTDSSVTETPLELMSSTITQDILFSTLLGGQQWGEEGRGIVVDDTGSM